MSIFSRSDRHLPVCPDLDQLKNQAKDLLRGLHAGEADAIAEFNEFHPKPPIPAEVKLADAQLALARSYQAPSWSRLVDACNLVDAIWQDDIETVRDLVTRDPKLLHEDALVRKNSNWGPPMSYAANVGRDRIIEMLYKMGATDLEHAIGRATLQGKVETARMLHGFLGSPKPPDDCLGGPAYTLNVEGTKLMFDLGARVYDDNGKRLAAVDTVLETDSRRPEAKHAILQMYADHGFVFPDTPTMAFHRGRIDLLEKHLAADPSLLTRTFAHEEIFPPELGCHNEIEATQGTPLKGTTLLHMCVDYDEMEIALWLLERGADVNTRAAIDEDGFGGHTALFCTVVSQPNFWMNYQGRPQVAPFTELLLARGADANIRASLRKQLHPGYAPRYDTEKLYEYRNITALEWGEQFHAKVFVSEPAMRSIRARGGNG